MRFRPPQLPFIYSGFLRTTPLVLSFRCPRVRDTALRQREMHGTRVICPLRARVLLTHTGCDRPELKRLIVLRVRQFGHRALHRTASVQRARIPRQALDCSGLSNVTRLYLVAAVIKFTITLTVSRRDTSGLVLITPIIDRVFREVIALEFSNDEDSRLSVDVTRDLINGFKHHRHLYLYINAELYLIQHVRFQLG
jgi:hypothetical protein